MPNRNDVDASDELGGFTDPMTNLQSSVLSPHKGTMLGKAVNQFVMPGFAVFRVGIETSDEDLGNSGSPSTLDSEPPLEELAPIGPNVDLDERALNSATQVDAALSPRARYL